MFIDSRSKSLPTDRLISDRDARAKTLIIEHPVRAGFKLIDTAKPFETARDVYRFEIKIAANGSLDFRSERAREDFDHRASGARGIQIDRYRKAVRNSARCLSIRDQNRCQRIA